MADPGIMDEENEGLEELIEDSGDRFLRFPTKYDIDEYNIMAGFIER